MERRSGTRELPILQELPIECQARHKGLAQLRILPWVVAAQHRLQLAGLLRAPSGSPDPILQGLDQVNHTNPTHSLAEVVGIQARLLMAR